MACSVKLRFMGCIMILSLKLQNWVACEPQVPCFFIFGDSGADNGNNNGLKTAAKANFPPYGIDFPDGPTGRFTNGRNYADFLGEFLGFDNFIPPFATTKGDEILQGLNYASGGSGILPDTGKNLGERITLDEQLQNHNITISRIAILQGNSESLTKEYLSKCIYLVGIGTNDYVNNYLMPDFYHTSSQYTPDEFATVLIQQYSKQIKTLHNYGARKIAMLGVGAVGCCPYLRQTYSMDETAASGKKVLGCVESANNAAQLFNNRLTALIEDLNNEIRNAKFVYVNFTQISATPPFVEYLPLAYTPCCTVSTRNYDKGACLPNKVPCSYRDTVFFDAFHITEGIVLPIAKRAYKASTPYDVYPMDIYSLAQLA